MDKLKTLKLNDWLVVAGGVLVLIAGLGRWFSWEVTVEEVVDLRGSGKSNAFDYLFTGVLPWLLVVGAGLVTLLLKTDALRPGKVPWPLVLLGATLLAAVLIVVRLIMGPDVDVEGTGVHVSESRGWGIWVSALGAVVAFVGAFIGVRNVGLEAEYKPVAAGRPPEREIPPAGDVNP